MIDPDNVASLRVARAVGAAARETIVNQRGEKMLRHVLVLPSPSLR